MNTIFFFLVLPSFFLWYIKALQKRFFVPFSYQTTDTINTKRKFYQLQKVFRILYFFFNLEFKQLVLNKKVVL